MTRGSKSLTLLSVSEHNNKMTVQVYEPDPIWKDVAPSFRHLTARELATFPGSHWTHGWKWTTVVTDMQMYMKYLLHRFVQVVSCATSYVE